VTELHPPENEGTTMPNDHDGQVLVDQMDELPRADDQPDPAPGDERVLPEPEPSDDTPHAAPKMDSDRDGMSDELELLVGTNLLDPDTDHDGLTDGFEYFSQAGLDPRLADTDGDLSEDGAELLAHTDPTNPDTDGDTIGDGRDLFPLDPKNEFLPSGQTDPDSAPNVDAETDAGPQDGPVLSPRDVDATLRDVDATLPDPAPEASNTEVPYAGDGGDASDSYGGDEAYEPEPVDDTAIDL
jgi:hypothetical protein